MRAEYRQTDRHANVLMAPVPAATTSHNDMLVAESFICSSRFCPAAAAAAAAVFYPASDRRVVAGVAGIHMIATISSQVICIGDDMLPSDQFRSATSPSAGTTAHA